MIPWLSMIDRRDFRSVCSFNKVVLHKTIPHQYKKFKFHIDARNTFKHRSKGFCYIHTTLTIFAIYLGNSIPLMPKSKCLEASRLLTKCILLSAQRVFIYIQGFHTFSANKRLNKHVIYVTFVNAIVEHNTQPQEKLKTSCLIITNCLYH